MVIKIGSALLVESDGKFDKWLQGLAQDVRRAPMRGADVVLVRRARLRLGGSVGLARGTLPLEQSQAAAAVGQIRLARAYEEALAPHGITTAQVL